MLLSTRIGDTPETKEELMQRRLHMRFYLKEVFDKVVEAAHRCKPKAAKNKSER